MDYDGLPSFDLVAYFRRVRDGKADDWPKPAAVLAEFRDSLREECLIIPSMICDNFVVQRFSPAADGFRVRVIDDIGSHAKVPLPFYCDFPARRHAAKSWRQLHLTQVEAGAVIGGGKRAFQKYESGEVLPSRAASNLLKVLSAEPRLLRVIEG